MPGDAPRSWENRAMKVIEDSFLSSNGKNRIRVKKWIPEGNPRGVIQYAHGLCGYIETAEETAKWFCKRGFIFVANDALGHGPWAAETGDLGYFSDSDGWTHVVNDFAFLFDTTRKDYPNLPYFVFGNSMGSFIVRTFLIRRPENISGAILTGTSMNPPEVIEGGKKVAYENLERKGGLRGRTGKLMAFCFGHYNDRFQPAETDSDWINRDHKQIETGLKDPLTQFFFTIGLFLDMTSGQEYNMRPENLEKMNKNTPILLLSGADDAAGEFGKGPKLAKEAFERAGLRDITLKLYDGARHDILKELNKEEVHIFILKWIETKMKDNV